MELYQQTDRHLPNPTLDQMNDSQIIKQIRELKAELAQKVLFLGHHYQNDEVIQFADIKGDSLKLAQAAAGIDREYIIFCGVHFMAETADMLTERNQKVILPDLNAGCSMADMANLEQIQKAWDYLKEHTNKKIIPITYINCTAELKAFVGKNGGCICTSSNAEKVVQWALENGDMVFFFPDQHLGRNTAHDLGIGLDEMNIYHPGHQFGGLEKSKIDSTKVLLWYGYCSVHQGFSLDQIKNIRRTNPKGKIIVHPECSFDVVQNSDDAGSTAYIIDQVKKAKAGEELYIGTEINLVNRLAHEHPHLSIKSLSPYQCLCTTMYRVRPRWLLNSLLSIKKEEPINIIRVNSEVTEYALMALDKMFEIS